MSSLWPHLWNSKTHTLSSMYKEVTGTKSGSHLRKLTKCNPASLCPCLPGFAFHQPCTRLSGRVHHFPPLQSFPLFSKPELISFSGHTVGRFNDSCAEASVWVCLVLWLLGREGAASRRPDIQTQPGVSLGRHRMETRCGARRPKETLLGSQAANPPSAGICCAHITLRFPEKTSSILLRNGEHKKHSGGGLGYKL